MTLGANSKVIICGFEHGLSASHPYWHSAMASPAPASAQSGGELAHLPAAQLVAHLRSNRRKAEFEAAARVLEARELEHADCERKAAALELELRASRSREETLKRWLDALPALERPQAEREETVRRELGECVPQQEENVVVLSSDSDEEAPGVSGAKEQPLQGERFLEEEEGEDDDDDVPLSQLICKRLRRMGNCGGGIGNSSQNCCFLRRGDLGVGIVEKEAAFLEKKVVVSSAMLGIGEAEKEDDELCQTPEKGGSFVAPKAVALLPLSGDGVPATGIRVPEKGNLQMCKTSVMEEISGSCRNKMGGIVSPECSSLSRQYEQTRSIGEGASNEAPKAAALSPLSNGRIHGRKPCNSKNRDDEPCNAGARKFLFQPGYTEDVMNSGDARDGAKGAPFIASKESVFLRSSIRSASLRTRETSGFQADKPWKPLEGKLPPAFALPKEPSVSLLRNTANWKQEEDFCNSLMDNPELCVQAVCALYRQRKLLVKSKMGSHTSGISARDVCRGIVLAEFLLDGNPNGPLKRTVDELENHDAMGLTSCMVIATKCCKQLFDIYNKKQDPYFCSQ